MKMLSVRPWRTLAAITLAAGMTFLGMGVQAAPATPWTVVAEDLDNPHGIGFAADGRLIVTESGHPGRVCLFHGQLCVGLNSKISAIGLSTGERTTLVSGLVSLAFAGPIETFGLGGVSVQGGHILAVIGLNPRALGQVSRACKPTHAACARTLKTAQQQAGRIIEVDPQGAGYSTVARVGAYNYKWVVQNDPSPGNPDFAPGDADPYGVLALPEGTYVADGGSNTLSFVDPAGATSVLAYVPDPPNHKPLFDAVATCVAQVGDAIYVGTLTGSLYKWENGALTRVLRRDKLRAIVGCTSDAAGNLYLVNLTERFSHFSPQPDSGSIVKVTPDLTTTYVVAPDQGLNFPNGITFGPDGMLYLTINSICPADPAPVYEAGLPKAYCPSGGQVVRLNG
jgi:hypothetical protein